MAELFQASGSKPDDQDFGVQAHFAAQLQTCQVPIFSADHAEGTAPESFCQYLGLVRLCIKIPPSAAIFACKPSKRVATGPGH